MKHLSEYRTPKAIRYWQKKIQQRATRKWNIMEICGGQTHGIVKFGLDQATEDQVNFIHGPGCPVCVTPAAKIDYAIELAQRGHILCSFGDMLRVRGSKSNLLQAKAEGADVRVVYSPMEALKIAEENPRQEVTFFAVGFETTAPANAFPVVVAKDGGVKNFSLIVAHVLVPPAMAFILSQAGGRIDGFLAAGHVCTVTGFEGYHKLSENYEMPIVVTGFEPADILQGLYFCIDQLESGRFRVDNQYPRSVRELGNENAVRMVSQVFELADVEWRGLGLLPQSGLKLQNQYADFDAERKFSFSEIQSCQSSDCFAGKVLQGQLKPIQCPSFGRECTPEHPIGAPMVSTEGACAAYYQYGRS